MTQLNLVWVKHELYRLVPLPWEISFPWLLCAGPDRPSWEAWGSCCIFWSWWMCPGRWYTEPPDPALHRTQPLATCGSWALEMVLSKVEGVRFYSFISFCSIKLNNGLKLGRQCKVNLDQAYMSCFARTVLDLWHFSLWVRYAANVKHKISKIRYKTGK